MNNRQDMEEENGSRFESSSSEEGGEQEHNSDDDMGSYDDFRDHDDDAINQRPNIRGRIQLSKEAIEAMKDEAKKQISSKYYITVDMIKKNMNDEFFSACFDPIHMLTRSTTFLPLRSEVKALPKYNDGEIKSNVSPTLLLMIVKFLFLLLFGPTYSIPLFGQVSNTWAFNMMLLFESYFSESEAHAEKLDMFGRLFSYCFDIKNRAEEASMLYDQILGNIDIRTPLFEVDFSEFLAAYSKVRAIEVRTEKALCAKQEYMTKICDILETTRTHAALMWKAHGRFEIPDDDQRRFFNDLFRYEIVSNQARLMHNTSLWRFSEFFPITLDGDIMGSYKMSPAMLIVNRMRLNANGFFSNGQHQNNPLIGNGFLQAEMNSELPMTSCKLKYALKAKIAKEALSNIKNARDGFRAAMENEMEVWMPDRYLNKPERMHGLGVPCSLDYEPEVAAEINLCAEIRSTQREQIQRSLNQTQREREVLPQAWFNQGLIEDVIEYRPNRPTPQPKCGLPPIEIRYSIDQKDSLDTRLAIDVCLACTDIFSNSVIYDHLKEEDKVICLSSRNQLVNLMRVMKSGIRDPLEAIVETINVIRIPYRGVRMSRIWNQLRIAAADSIRRGAVVMLRDALNADQLMARVDELCEGLGADAYMQEGEGIGANDLHEIEGEIGRLEQRRIRAILEEEGKH